MSNIIRFLCLTMICFFFFSSRRRHTRSTRDWSSDVCSSDLRFGLVSPDGAVLHSSNFACADFAEIGLALDAYLAMRGNLPKPRKGALSVAALRDRLGLDQLVTINDFTAVALALPRLTAADRMPVGGGAPVEGRPIGVLGPGSGLGVSGMIPAGSGWVALAGEGGHVTMAAANERESAVLELMRRGFDHVSAERCLSGPGLVNLDNSLAALDRVPSAPYTAAQITDPETAARDPLCREATAMFCAMLGTVAGDLVLTLGAQGGVYIAGGIVPRLGARFVESGFRARFEAKGRLSTHLAAIPSYVVTHPLPAFLGCVVALS